MKRVAVIGVLSAFLLSPLPALANPLDVPADSWYSSVVSDFVSAGYFDETQPFRPTEKATRAEFVQLLVRLQGGVAHAPFTSQSFDDVAPNNPFFNFFEEGGLAGWIKGTGSCYGNHPCTANPNSPINRAEAATLLIRAFKLEMSNQAPSFTDNPSNQWFTVTVNSAASLCILQGDAGGKKVRPSDNMIRAEMITMLQRAIQHLNYPNCNAVTSSSLPAANVKSSPILLPPEGISSSVASSSAPSTREEQFCTLNDWICDPWGPCLFNGTQMRKCTLNKSNGCSYVRATETAPLEQECSFFDMLPQQMKANLDKWDSLHEEMINAAKALIPQGYAAKAGIDRINKVESRLINQLNAYVNIYNEVLRLTKDLKTVWNRQDEVTQIETEVKLIEKDFKAIPTVWY